VKDIYRDGNIICGRRGAEGSPFPKKRGGGCNVEMLFREEPGDIDGIEKIPNGTQGAQKQLKFLQGGRNAEYF